MLGQISACGAIGRRAVHNSSVLPVREASQRCNGNVLVPLPALGHGHGAGVLRPLDRLLAGHMQGRLRRMQGLADEINETGCDNCCAVVPRKLQFATVKKQSQRLVPGLKMQEKDKP